MITLRTLRVDIEKETINKRCRDAKKREEIIWVV